MSTIHVQQARKVATVAANLPNHSAEKVVFLSQKLSKTPDSGYWSRFMFPTNKDVVTISNNALAAMAVAGEGNAFKAVPVENADNELREDILMSIHDGVITVA